MLNDTSSAPEPSAHQISHSPVYSTVGSSRIGSASSEESSPPNPVREEQAMWRAVIVQALMDAACGSQKHEAIQAKNEALIWLRGTSQDFATVCYYAGYEPDFVRMMVKKSLENGCQWRALPGEGTRIRHTRLRSTTKKARQRR